MKKGTTLQRALWAAFLALIGLSQPVAAQMWKAMEPETLPIKRHENAMAEVNGKLYLIGGRGVKAVNQYDPKKDSWSTLVETPLEMSHFQAVTYKDEIWVLGAFTGSYPHEVPIPNVYIFNPSSNSWRQGPEIPQDRRRGAAGAFTHNGKIYLACGIQDGHWDGQVAWLDEYDPKTNTWTKLSDAPRPRDHVQVALLNNKLYVAGGRLSSAKTKDTFTLTVKEVDVYDFDKGTWSTLAEENNIPTPRAGCTAVAYKNKILVIGGESGAQTQAHAEVEAFNPKTNQWEKLPSLHQGRHGTQAVFLNKKVYISAGSANRGGGPELNDLEVLVK
ncbi:N-acetylneuraminic acid mutarotase [Dyadobacter jejuensis]|uniref:N-acetylneuraminic acid mutarotase n=1 Tax=Dyadobacter jejuensis TaxID=1082580 RepID=A0A316AQA9_9BACT|nr:kelch-like protein [Dyadobacter jejuensis]PWJ59641.1 N-acetylneuraminic acid mutarotase [Dyadobacter jejuensis]